MTDTKFLLPESAIPTHWYNVVADLPFFISDGELSFANSHELEFYLYRVFDFRRAPRLFELRGRPDHQCRLDPTTYRASFS